MSPSPRIILISALAQSPEPAMAAMAEIWPEARGYNLLDESLSADYAALGAITPEIFGRFLALGRYAAAASDGTSRAEGILFTCSAFRPAIERVKADLAIPVVTPNEGAFDEALRLCAGRLGGGKVGVLLTFAGSVAPLTGEIAAMAEAIGQPCPELVPAVATGALEVLQAGDGARHDALAAAAVAALPPVDVIVIGQFSMARAAGAVRAALAAAGRHEPVLTTPHMAAAKLRRLVEAA
jgi:hypothetical protein